MFKCPHFDVGIKTCNLHQTWTQSIFVQFEKREGGTCCRVLQSCVWGAQNRGAQGRVAGRFVRLILSGQIAAVCPAPLAFDLDVHRKKHSLLPSTIKGSCLACLIITQKGHINDVSLGTKLTWLGSGNDWWHSVSNRTWTPIKPDLRPSRHFVALGYIIWNWLGWLHIAGT